MGCAEGHTLEFLKKHGEWEMEGVELNAEAAQKAKEKGFKVYNGAFEEVDIPNEQFDLVRMNHLIEHVTDPMVMINKTYKILKPQGFLLIETPNIDCLDFKIFKRYWGALQLPRHIYFFNKKTLTQMLIANKFQVVHVGFSLLTTGWALSIQNFIQSRKRHPLYKGRIKGYVILLLLFSPVVFFQKLLNRSTIMSIVARK